MATTISVADDVYEWMKKNKEEKSFSELIRDMMGETDFEELRETGISDNWEETEDAVEEASEETWEKIEENTE